jgi:carbamate kinase
MIGYLITVALANALPGREIATLLTQVEVDPDDPAFVTPTKPIGPVYTVDEMTRMAEQTHWRMMRDGDHWRRAVASPMPLRIREIESIRLLLCAGVVVVCAGGGGIPVVATTTGQVTGVEAVVDKDLTAALLAEQIGADMLLILTDVPAVWTRWPMTEGTPIESATPEQLRAYGFAAGSMGPKVEAACRFVERTGHEARIGAIDQAEEVMQGAAGTTVRPV